MKNRLRLTSLLLGIVLLTAGCATSPYQGEAKIKSDLLLKQQLDSADVKRASKPSGRIIFAGFAMHSQSKAFRNDILLAENSILSIDPNAIIFKLNNPAFGQDADWPYATTQNIEQILRKLSAMARDEDKVVILMSTHGYTEKLAINFSSQNYPYVTPRLLNEWMSGLHGKATLLLLSACYSGSFLPAVSGPSRIVLTAAAKDRSSFGCQFYSSNTYFIDALFNQGVRNASIEQLMEQAKGIIDKKEKAQKLSPPSLPQISVGEAARVWAGQAMTDWLVP